VGEPEFVDPGPNQADPVPAGAPFCASHPGPPPGDAPAVSTGRREILGLVVMLLAAAVLPLIASMQTLFAVHEQSLTTSVDFSVDAWGDLGSFAADRPYSHGIRFGLLLVGCAMGYVVLLLAGALVFLGERSGQPRRAAGLIAGAATGLLGLLLGTTLAMTLEIQSAFDSLRSSAGAAPTPVVEVRLRIGGAVWFAAAGLLAGVLVVTAALRLRRVWPDGVAGRLDPALVVEDTPGWR
jgi:hypothetical protein